MDIPLEISFRNTEHSAALEARIREKVEWLSQYFHHVNSCRVTLETAHRHGQNGKIHHVKIDIGLPGKRDVIINREPEQNHAHEDLNVAIRDAFDKARRKLQDAAAKMSGDVKARNMPGTP